jgi:sirohydrochlorin cobaltochelatase
VKAAILFGHGSRDPQWRRPIEAVAQRLAGRLPVRCAYLELDTPDLATAAGELIAQGATELRILPMFLGAGRHAREDLPRLVEALQIQHPDVRFELRPTVGEDPRLLGLLADLAAE